MNKDVTVLPDWLKAQQQQNLDTSKNVSQMTLAEREKYAVEVSMLDSENHLRHKKKGTGWLARIKGRR